MSRDYFAKEAERLLRDDVLNATWDELRTEALDALVSVPAGDTLMVLKWQQRIQAIDEIRAALSRHIPMEEQASNKATPFA